MVQRKMVMVANQINLKDANQEAYDLSYWLLKTPQERMQAVTYLVRQNMTPGQRMDKTVWAKRSMK